MGSHGADCKARAYSQIEVMRVVAGGFHEAVIVMTTRSDYTPNLVASALNTGLEWKSRLRQSHIIGDRSM